MIKNLKNAFKNKRMLNTGNRRRVIYIFLGVFVLLLLASTRHERVRAYFPPGFPYSTANRGPQKGMTNGPLPGPGPTYSKYTTAEKALPQHNLDLKFPEGREGRYVKFSSQIRALGWNNVLNEVLLCSHLSWRANRTYVFQDYYWKPDYYPWNVPDWPWPQNPLTTLIAGPTAGGPWDESDPSPRAVREDWFDVVCPKEEREIIDTDVGKAPVKWSGGKEVMDHWVDLLSSSKARCVEVVPSLSGNDSFSQVFDLWLIGDGRSLSIWPEFKISPVSRLLSASPLVLQAIRKNSHLFYPPTPRDPTSIPALKFAYGYNPFSHLMAVHIRRGDYLEACIGLANWNSTFYGWNLLPELPDPFTSPPIDFPPGQAAPETHEAYKKRCLPTNEYILDKIASSKSAWEQAAAPHTDSSQTERRRLDVLFIMTNAKQDWIDDFKLTLKSSNAGWRKVVTTRDIDLDFEETGVNMAVDMELARMAAVYIGNGVSTESDLFLFRDQGDEDRRVCILQTRGFL